MIGGWRRMLLVLTLIVGVLGMHALVLVPTAPMAGESRPPSVATAPVTGPDGSDRVSVGAHDPVAMAAMATVRPVLDHGEGQGAGHGPMPSSMHQVLHLCLAILAGLLVLGAAAWALWPSQPAGHQGVSIGALARRAPRRRPPPTSVRLAQLCVLRN